MRSMRADTSKPSGFAGVLERSGANQCGLQVLDERPGPGRGPRSHCLSFAARDPFVDLPGDLAHATPAPCRLTRPAPPKAQPRGGPRCCSRRSPSSPSSSRCASAASADPTSCGRLRHHRDHRDSRTDAEDVPTPAQSRFRAEERRGLRGRSDRAANCTRTVRSRRPKWVFPRPPSSSPSAPTGER